MEDTNRCVCCGAIIPEGTQICRTCEKEANRDACLHLWQFDQIVIGESGEKYMSWKCAHCGQSRMEKPHSRSILWPDTEG